MEKDRQKRWSFLHTKVLRLADYIGELLCYTVINGTKGRMEMLPSDMDYLVRRERCQDLMREAAHDRLIQEARLGQYDVWESQRRMVGWLRGQMIKWGTKLHLL
jgi:hypothetical protein